MANIAVFWAGGTYQLRDLFDLLWSLLKALLVLINEAVALVNPLTNVAHTVELEPPLLLLLLAGRIVLGLEHFGVDLGAWALISLGVGEQVEEAGANEVRTADFGVGDAHLLDGRAGAVNGFGAHELLCRMHEHFEHLLIFDTENLPSSLRCSAAMIARLASG